MSTWYGSWGCFPKQGSLHAQCLLCPLTLSAYWGMFHFSLLMLILCMNSALLRFMKLFQKALGLTAFELKTKPFLWVNILKIQGFRLWLTVFIVLVTGTVLNVLAGPSVHLTAPLFLSCVRFSCFLSPSGYTLISQARVKGEGQRGGGRKGDNPESRLLLLCHVAVCLFVCVLCLLGPNACLCTYFCSLCICRVYFEHPYNVQASPQDSQTRPRTCVCVCVFEFSWKVGLKGPLPQLLLSLFLSSSNYNLTFRVADFQHSKVKHDGDWIKRLS